MFLNIITPCSRPKNLHKIAASINIPRDNYRWIVVFDAEEPPEKDLIPDNCEWYCYKDPKSVFGNAQRNLALDKVTEGYIYFNDDDTTIHPELWENIKDCEEDMILFKQIDQQGTMRIGKLDFDHIDSHTFVVSHKIIGDTRWKNDIYWADGVFARECAKKKKSLKKIDKVLSLYNSLRTIPVKKKE